MSSGRFEQAPPPYRCVCVTTPSFARLRSGFLLSETEMTNLSWLRSSFWMLSAVVCTMTITMVSDALAQNLSGRVVGVTDGDTITLLDGDRVQHKIRLSGIDAPERSQAFGRRSREHLASLVAGERVTVETDNTDRFGRSVGKVLFQGRDINLAMVVAGLAWHYKKYEMEQSAVERLSYANAEVQARESHAGLWRDPEPTAPWDWRAEKRSRQ